MSILVTGAAGFIGCNCVLHLNREGINDVIAVDNLTKAQKFQNLAKCRISDYFDKNDFIARVRNGSAPIPEAIIHMGACSDTMETDGRYIMENNYRYTLDLFAWAQKQRIPFVYASSAATYGASTVFVEDVNNEGPLNCYGYSKYLFDQVLRSRMATLSAPAAGMRFFNVYGPHEQHKGRMASVAFHQYFQFKKEGKVKLFEGCLGYGNGCQMLLEILDMYYPGPDENFISGTNTKTGEGFTADYNDQKPFSARVYKTLVDPFIGKYSMIKVCSGVLKPDTTVLNVNKDTEEKIGRLYVLRGKEAIEVPELRAGDLGAIAKLSVTTTGDSLATKEVPIQYEKTELSVPYTYMAYRAKNKGDEDKIASALGKLMEEDQTLRSVNDKENRQLLLYGIGEQQLEVVVSKLMNRYKVEIELSRPKVAFRETIRGKVKVQGKHKKQSGGHGQYGDVTIEFEPSGDLEKPYVFEEKIVGGVVPKNYFPAVEKGIQEMVVKGPLAGYPIVGLKATLVFGSYHPVDSSEMAFKLATILAVKAAFADPASKPVLLEPIASLQVKVPDKFTGDIMGDLNKRRGRVLGMNPDHSGNQIVEADVPMSELFGYNTDLRSMTGGIGSYSYSFSRYEQAPADVQAKEIAARAAEND